MASLSGLLSRAFYLVSLNVISLPDVLSITKVVKSFLAWRTSKVAEYCSALLCVAVRCSVHLGWPQEIQRKLYTQGNAPSVARELPSDGSCTHL